MSLKKNYIALIAAALALPATALAQPPNVVFILADDLGWQDVGEKHDVAAQHPEIADTLIREADRVRSELGGVNVFGSDQRPTGLVNPQE